jgi:hypothetical protein
MILAFWTGRFMGIEHNRQHRSLTDREFVRFPRCQRCRSNHRGVCRQQDPEIVIALADLQSCLSSLEGFSGQ